MRAETGGMGNPEKQDSQQRDIGGDCYLGGAFLQEKPGAALFRCKKRV